MLLYFLPLLTLSLAFNVDIRNPTVFYGEVHGEQFGFAVALASVSGGAGVYVGAPRGERVRLVNFNITHSGVMYKCHLETKVCESIAISDRANRRVHNFMKPTPPPGTIIEYEDQSNQRLGFSISSTKNGAVAVCAPMYVYLTPRGIRREATGNCYISRDHANRFMEVSPCRRGYAKFYRENYPDKDTAFASYHMTGHGMCGFSVSVSEDDGDLGIGSVGSYYWSGKLYSMGNRPATYRNSSSTREPDYKLDDDTYMTWALEHIEFDGDSSTVEYVATAPRAAYLKGRLMIWSKRNGFPEPDSLYNKTGFQPGAYFGYSLAVSDFNGDGDDDIAVGAPFWSDYENDKIEIGQVNVFIRKRAVTFQTLPPITGRDASGRFGLSLAAVGDLNGDGYGDLVVGAPYAGANKRGVIYVYNGKEDGFHADASQVITSEQVSEASQPLSTFGWSIAGNMDLDNNQYSDIAVGAYKSESAVVFQSRPPVRITGSVAVSPQSVQLPVGCAVNQPEVKTFEVTVCLSVQALEQIQSVTLKVTLELDNEKNLTRRAFDSKTQLSHSIRDNLKLTIGDTSKCFITSAYVNSNIRDKTSQIKMAVRYEIVDYMRPGSSSAPPPILDQFAPSISPAALTLSKSCDKCTPDLSIQASTLTQFYILGSNEKIEVKIRIGNTGEDSYLTSLNITLPDDVSYINTQDVQSCISIACRQVTSNGTEKNYITCDIGNPFPSNQTAVFSIGMRVMNLHSIDQRELNFKLKVGSAYQPQDLDDSDNSAAVVIPMRVETSIFISGVSQPGDGVIVYDKQHIEAKNKRGPLVDHKYEVYTKGPSAIKTARLLIRWPMYASTSDGYQYLLYMYEKPEIIKGHASCQVFPQYINPSNITLPSDVLVSQTERQRRRRSTLSLDDKTVTCVESENLICVPISCMLYDLRPSQSVIITVRSFLWMSDAFKNLTSDYTRDRVLGSTATVNVTTVPYSIRPAVLPTASFTVKSYFEKTQPPKIHKPLEWKWIAIGVGSGLILLIIIILILWRCGFFKRYRPHEEVKVEKYKDGEPHETVRLKYDNVYS